MKIQDTISIIKSSNLEDLQVMQQNYINLSGKSEGSLQRKFILLNNLTSKRITQLQQ